MCKVLGVSESGYYRYIGNKDKPGKDKVLSVAIKEILDENPLNDNYGVPRIQMALEQRRIRAGKRRITRIMRENGWLHTKKRRPYGLTKADPQAMITENLIKQDFSEYSALWKALNPREGKQRYAARKATIRAWKAAIRPRKALFVYNGI